MYDQEKRFSIEELFKLSPFREWSSGQECAEYVCSQQYQIDDSYYVGVIRELSLPSVRVPKLYISPENFQDEIR